MVGRQGQGRQRQGTPPHAGRCEARGGTSDASSLWPLTHAPADSNDWPRGERGQSQVAPPSFSPTAGSRGLGRAGLCFVQEEPARNPGLKSRRAFASEGGAGCGQEAWRCLLHRPAEPPSSAVSLEEDLTGSILLRPRFGAHGGETKDCHCQTLQWLRLQKPSFQGVWALAGDLWFPGEQNVATSSVPARTHSYGRHAELRGEVDAGENSHISGKAVPRARGSDVSLRPAVTCCLTWGPAA